LTGGTDRGPRHQRHVPQTARRPNQDFHRKIDIDVNPWGGIESMSGGPGPGHRVRGRGVLPAVGKEAGTGDGKGNVGGASGPHRRLDFGSGGSGLGMSGVRAAAREQVNGH